MTSPPTDHTNSRVLPTVCTVPHMFRLPGSFLPSRFAELFPVTSPTSFSSRFVLTGILRISQTLARLFMKTLLLILFRLFYKTLKHHSSILTWIGLGLNTKLCQRNDTLSVAAKYDIMFRRVQVSMTSVKLSVWETFAEFIEFLWVFFIIFTPRALRS